MEIEIINKLKKLIEYEYICYQYQQQCSLEDELDYQACEQCPLNDHPYCELGKIRIELQEYFKEHRYILPKEIIDILVYCKCNND